MTEENKIVYESNDLIIEVQKITFATEEEFDEYRKLNDEFNEIF